jgi:hypothetical protein
MTNDPFSVFVMEMNVAHFQAMLKLDMDDAKRSVIEQLLDEAKSELALAKKDGIRSRETSTARTG